jgi:hypothetical protein
MKSRNVLVVPPNKWKMVVACLVAFSIYGSGSIAYADYAHSSTNLAQGREFLAATSFGNYALR